MNHLHTKGFQKLTKINDALRILFNALGEQSPQDETVPVNRALGRYLARDVVATHGLPQFDKAVMDGYAVRATDVKNASQENPTILHVKGQSRIGAVCRIPIGPREAIAVATGSMVPPGADTVAIVERTKRLPGGKVSVHAPATPGQGLVRKGDDVASGSSVLKKGTRVRAQDVGILKALGFTRVAVVNRPRIAILSTGDELEDSTSKRTEGKIIDVNRPILSAMLHELGAEAIDLGIVKDDGGRITSSLKKGLKKSDAVLVTAGSSVGKRDLVPECISRLGKPGMLVHGIAMRPAMPTGLAVVNGKPLLSLPGFPVSAIFGFRVFARPLIARLMGIPEEFEPTLKAVLKERIVGTPGLRTYVRVLIEREEEGLVADPLKSQRSSALMSFVAANGIVTIPEEIAEIEKGRTVDVIIVGQIPR
jgi:molybdopterin molybdotransferase